jgi:predicted nucleotide-binding protein (sugar kinase/HSP70/actin superfamily)
VFDFEAERRRRLSAAGLPVERPRHFKRPVERPFTREERGQTTILFGGLTRRHDQLIAAGMRALGAKVALIPPPRKADFQTGREYGDNALCNPAYFTIGALINYLKDLRDNQGIATEQILRDYVLLTAGACGPCRFGMYEAEYRLALRNSGFDGFRVIAFQQKGGIEHANPTAGVDFNLDFFLTVIDTIFIGDLLNEIAYHIRPYETEPGRTNAVFDKCLALCRQRLRERDLTALRGGLLARLLSAVSLARSPADAVKYLDQWRGDYLTSTLRQCARMIDDEIEVDYTRPRPVAKIIGEFWAQTTEGDGNFNMFRFLEEEGAEVLVTPVANWITYLVNQARNQADDRRGLDEHEPDCARWSIGRRLRQELRYRRKTIRLTLAERLLMHIYDRLRRALGGTAHPLADQAELVRLAHPHYNSRTAGGEGHLEVAKNIYYTSRELAHMVLSLKPFGCLPSTQSDGAQAAVINRHPDMIFLPIETSGDGDINAYSRVQMALGDAKFKCKTELNQAVARTGYSLEQIREYVRQHSDLRRPLLRIPHHAGIAGRAANFVLLVGRLMDRDPSVVTKKNGPR